MPLSNPFSISYLTEASLTPDELLARYSFLPFRHVHEQLARPINVFLVGRKGVGKTMLLKLFEPEIMARLFKAPPAEDWVLDSFPKATLGVYLNFASPIARLGQFQSMGSERQWWISAYSDYLNTFLLDGALNSLETMATVQPWREASGLNTDVPFSHDLFVNSLLAGLREESATFEGIESIAGLRDYLRRRLQQWTRFSNMEVGKEGAPQTPLVFGMPLFRFVSAVRQSQMFSRPFRLFVLADQYEHLYQLRRVIDLRPIFNEAMSMALRGGTGVEFKIGTRQYAYKNFGLWSNDGRIEANREMVEIELDQLARRYYSRFAEDLVRKRLDVFIAESGARPKVRSARTLLPKLDPRKEAELYVAESPFEHAKHLLPFLERWEKYGVPRAEGEDIVRRTGVSAAHPLSATLAGIGTTRWLRDGANDTPLWMEGMPSHESRGQKPDLAMALSTLAKAVEERYLLRPSRNRALEPRSRFVEDFVHDNEAAALFQIASAYKNQRKLYCGFGSAVRVSSNVAVVLIQILYEACEHVLMSGESLLQGSIPPRSQSEAMYNVSEKTFHKIRDDFDYGERLHRLIGYFGASLREVQLELTVPQPAANGVSVREGVIEDNTDAASTPRDNPSMLAREAISWGLLEEREHQSKDRGSPRRTKIYINRVFCPYFGLAEVWKKDPVYVEDWPHFINCLIEGNRPAEFARVLARASGHYRPEGGSLFSEGR